ncbi:MAG: hypothetical protein ACRCZP_11525 [Phycicoccus sp.]
MDTSTSTITIGAAIVAAPAVLLITITTVLEFTACRRITQQRRALQGIPNPRQPARSTPCPHRTTTRH